MPPPEVVFDRYFRESHIKGYSGKHALLTLDPVELGPLLEATQEAVDEGLDRADHPQHLVHPPADSRLSQSSSRVDAAVGPGRRPVSRGGSGDRQ